MNSIEWVTQTINTNNVKRFAEVGVLHGELAEPVLKSCRLDVYIMVERTVNDRLYQVVKDSDIKGEFDITQKPLTLMRMESTQAASLIADGSLDMVYIDADHTYKDVQADLAAWTPKVRIGGIISGHDYNPNGDYLVWKAVDEKYGKVNLADDDIWWVINKEEFLTVQSKPSSGIITNFRDKKLIDYLKELPDGGKALIRFGHGWGDTQMFMQAFWKLQRLFPNLTIDIYLECGQEDIFKSYPVKDSKEHDLVFSLDFPMSEGSDVTKVGKCCIDELGILPVEALPAFDDYASPFVACHFQGTALPGSVNCPNAVATKIWNEIIEFGKIPIECHFEHCFHNSINAKYSFITSTVRGTKPTLKNLIGLIQRSFAFIGVASGPFVTAMCEIPQRTLYLERNHKLETYTRMNIAKINVMDYKDGSVIEWLRSIN